MADIAGLAAALSAVSLARTTTAIAKPREVSLESRTVLDFFELSIFQSIYQIVSNVDLSAFLSKSVCELVFGYRSGISKSARAWTAIPPPPSSSDMDTPEYQISLRIQPVNLANIYRECNVALQSLKMQFNITVKSTMDDELDVWKQLCEQIHLELQSCVMGTDKYRMQWTELVKTHQSYYLIRLSHVYLSDFYLALFGHSEYLISKSYSRVSSYSETTTTTKAAADATADCSARVIHRRNHILYCGKIVSLLSVILDIDQVQNQMIKMLFLNHFKDLPSKSLDLLTDKMKENKLIWTHKLYHFLFEKLPNDYQTLQMVRLLLKDEYQRISMHEHSSLDDLLSAEVRVLLTKLAVRFPGSSHTERSRNHLNEFIQRRLRSLR